MRRQRITTSTCRSPRSGFQSRFNTLTQISPDLEMFGWKTFVRKKPANPHSPHVFSKKVVLLKLSLSPFCTLWRCLWEFRANDKFHSEKAALIWCASCSITHKNLSGPALSPTSRLTFEAAIQITWALVLCSHVCNVLLCDRDLKGTTGSCKLLTSLRL